MRAGAANRWVVLTVALIPGAAGCAADLPAFDRPVGAAADAATESPATAAENTAPTGKSPADDGPPAGEGIEGSPPGEGDEGFAPGDAGDVTDSAASPGGNDPTDGGLAGDAGPGPGTDAGDAGSENTADAGGPPPVGDDAGAVEGAEGSGPGTPDAGEPPPPGCSEPDLTLGADMGEAKPGAIPKGTLTAPCDAHRWRFYGPKGAAMRVRLTAVTKTLIPRIGLGDGKLLNGYGGQPIKVASGPRGGQVTAVAALGHSGEHLIHVSGASDTFGDYALELLCDSGCDNPGTRFPIVLAHGFSGFEDIGPVNYFFGVKDHLEKLGYQVFTSQVDAYNTPEVRAGQLAQEVDRALAEMGARKVNIIGHSQGGLDARALISLEGYGDRVGTAVLYATPNRGTSVADVALGILPGPAESILGWLLNVVGFALSGTGGQDAEKAIYALSMKYVTGEFNPKVVDDPRVRYLSWTGVTCRTVIACGDSVEQVLTIPYDIIKAKEGDNDGMVSVASAQWGDFRGTVPADHLDEVGHLLGVTGPNFDHYEFFEMVAQEVRAGDD